MSEPAFTRNVILRGFETLSSELARREAPRTLSAECWLARILAEPGDELAQAVGE